jgi:membrane-associated phospholipid phosphatase
VNYGLKTGFRSIMGDAGNRPMHYPVQTNSLVGRANAYGFPSGHAQSVGYFLAFAHQFLPWRAWHPGWIVAAVLVAAWMLHTRVAFRHHTVIQVLFGFGFGVLVFRLLHSWVRS